MLAMFVALGAVLAAQPFDAWTPVYAPSDSDAPPVGDHALPSADERRVRVARSRRVVVRDPARRRRPSRWPGTLRRRRRSLHALLLPNDSWGRSRAVPAPDRAPPRLLLPDPVRA
jgi:hypothetical protein